MFNTEFLHVIRSYELEVIKAYLTPGAKVLEIGGGTGIQAKLLDEQGFNVVSIDLPRSQYALDRVFSVIDYDGEHIPFGDRTFDVVLSSNVLEHVENLPALQNEIRRVLRPEGYCVHIMPSASWRFWTNLTHYVDLIQRIGLVVPRLIPSPRHPVHAGAQVLGGFIEIAKLVRQLVWLPPRHGERGNAITEIYYFGRIWWRRHFAENGYDVIDLVPTGLFYTGHMVFGPKLTVRRREKIARFLDSACYLFRVRPSRRGNDA